MDRAATGRTFVFCYLTYGSRTANRTDSLYQTVNGLVGNVDWGESLTVVACEFRGLNRVFFKNTPKNLAPETFPPVTVLKAVNFVENSYIMLATKL